MQSEQPMRSSGVMSGLILTATRTHSAETSISTLYSNSNRKFEENDQLGLK